MDSITNCVNCSCVISPLIGCTDSLCCTVGIINGSLVSIDLWSFIHTLVFCGIGWSVPLFKCWAHVQFVFRCFPSNFWSVFAGGCFFEVHGTATRDMNPMFAGCRDDDSVASDYSKFRGRFHIKSPWLICAECRQYGKRSSPIQFGIYGLIRLVISWGQFCSANGLCTSARWQSWGNLNGDSHLRLAWSCCWPRPWGSQLLRFLD